MTRALPFRGARPAGAPSTSWTSGRATSRPARRRCASASRAADGLLSLVTDPVGADLLAACPDLKAIANMAVGTDNIDLEAAAERGIPVGNTPDVLTDATADLAFALLLALARRIPEGAAQVREGRWRTWEPAAGLGADLAGATLGIVGRGRIGDAVARRAEGFGMEVLASSRRSGVPLEELLERADFVSLHCPLTPATRHLIGTEALRADEADRVPGQHRARRRRRPDRAAPRAARAARSPAPRSTSPTPSRCPPTTRCWRRRTCSSSRTSARPRCARASGWPRWPSRTCSRRSPAARCPTPSERARRGRRRRDELDAAARRRRGRGRRRGARPPLGRHPPRRGRRRDRPARRRAAASACSTRSTSYAESIERHGCERRIAVLTSAVRDAANGARVRRRRCATASGSTRARSAATRRRG